MATIITIKDSIRAKPINARPNNALANSGAYDSERNKAAKTKPNPIAQQPRGIVAVANAKLFIALTKTIRWDVGLQQYNRR